ncbi:MAG: hypothetical protein JW954_01755 [Dehalococcoidaceae bacterium]|nr:hypothetical protein [Dehalococcoidaceae bacterium]
MPLKVQVIPCFNLQNMKLTGFSRQIAGGTGDDSISLAGYFGKNGASQIAFFDIDSPRERFEKWAPVVAKAAENAGIPVIFGNSMNTFEDCEKILKAGADKVAVDVYTDTDPSIIDRLSRTYGSKRVVVALNARKNAPDTGLPRFEILHRTGEVATGLNLVEWIKMAQMLGAGSVILNSQEKAGTGVGYDIELLKAVTAAVSIPVIACGGAGKLADFAAAVVNAGASGVAAASVFISGKLTPRSVKEYLQSQGIETI